MSLDKSKPVHVPPFAHVRIYVYTYNYYYNYYYNIHTVYTKCIRIMHMYQLVWYDCQQSWQSWVLTVLETLNNIVTKRR